ncbi:MAG: FHIPEP family type III secretion protein [Gemmatimonadales bacterium]
MTDPAAAPPPISPPGPARLALEFTAAQWAAFGGPKEAGFEILTGPGGLASSPEPELANLAARALQRAAEALGLPVPAVKVVESDRLLAEEFAISAGGRPRFLGRWDQSFEQWWAEHPVAGRLGRTGLAGPTAEGLLSPAARVARAVEEVVWDDPGLLWSRDAARRWLGDEPAERSTGRRGRLQSDALRDLVARRIPLVDHAGVTALLGRLTAPSEDSTVVEAAASELFPSEIAVHIGSDLEVDVSGERFAGVVGLVLEGLSAELGITFPLPKRQIVPALAPRAYEIAINGLVRATSDIPEDRRFTRTPRPGVEAGETIPWISPVAGWTGAWAVDPAGAMAGPDVSWDAAEFLGLHLAACLREAAAEFCDLAWVQQTFDRLEQLYPKLLELARARFPEQRIAAVLRGLLAEGVSVATLPQILERLLEYELLPPAPLCLDDNEMHGALAWTTDAIAPLVEYVRSSLKDYLSYQQGRGSGTLGVFLLSPRLEADLRGRLRAGGNGAGICDARTVIPLLRELRQELGRHPGAELPAVLTSVDIRSPLRRLLAAQHPLVRVLSFNDLTPSSSIQPLARLDG